ASGKHTIMLMQTGTNNSSRTFREYDSPNQALTSIIKMYEGRLKELNPGVPNISYDISDLFAYIDSLQDLAVLVFDAKSLKYDPFPKDWIKQQVYASLKAQATSAAAGAAGGRRR
ncbi:ERH, partial [Symbiodinium sp. KB8]